MPLAREVVDERLLDLRRARVDVRRRGRRRRVGEVAVVDELRRGSASPSMSKLRFNMIFSNVRDRRSPRRSASSRAGPPPRRPTRRSGPCWPAPPSLANCSASSRLNAEPVPLSLMPGPSGTESRCEPTSDDLGRVAARRSRPGCWRSSASSLSVSVARCTVALPVVASATPSVVRDADRRDRDGRAERAGEQVLRSAAAVLPWLKRSRRRRRRPRRSATLSPKRQVPRCISAIAPRPKPRSPPPRSRSCWCRRGRG